HYYSLTDNNPGKETNYYRLTQVDYNGQSETFNIIACDFITADQVSSVNVYTVSGALIRSFVSSDFRKELNELPLADGIYLVEITNGNEQTYLKYFRSDGVFSYGN
ncbi:MAG TPA: T9SS type A sorting domain-containing protein, partial [Bacteroidia bacterium]|nr:T9SS type A sorting domain-containing protein [Bacteroidia bacterium]